MTDRERERRRYDNARTAYNALMKVYPLTADDLDGEIWRDIDGYEGVYQVSNFGRVKSFTRRRSKILKPALSFNGYLHVGLFFGGKQRKVKVHRLVVTAFISNPENKPQVNHIDGNRFNNHLLNLEWATATENMLHAYSTGLLCPLRGETSPKAKLTNEQVEWIRDNANIYTQDELSETFGIDRRVISSIQLGRKWKSVGGAIRLSKKAPRVPDDVREEIRHIYIKGSHEFGVCGLAEKYNLNPTTVAKIIHENK